MIDVIVTMIVIVTKIGPYLWTLLDVSIWMLAPLVPILVCNVIVVAYGEFCDPADTGRNDNVIITSKRRCNVVLTY